MLLICDTFWEHMPDGRVPSESAGDPVQAKHAFPHHIFLFMGFGYLSYL